MGQFHLNELTLNLLMIKAKSVADPEFPRGGGANPQGGGAYLLFAPKIPKNCMKMKEFGPGGAHPCAPS